jgi:dTDP-4-dehydrorhamnose reductase
MILVIGGTGILGKELCRLSNDILPTNSEYDLFSFQKLEELLELRKPKIVINCASIKSEKVDLHPLESINLNIIGSANISKYCIKNNIRLVYISTDYVYPGVKGNYSEQDFIHPNNKYAWTKIGGESSVQLVKNHLIIRTSFGENKFPYDFAYDNLYTSKDYVDVIAPLIYRASVSELTGILNIGTERKTIFEYANRRNIVPSKSLSQQRDFSLSTQKFNEINDTNFK